MTTSEIIVILQKYPADTPVMSIDHKDFLLYEEIAEVFTMAAQNEQTREVRDVAVLSTIKGTKDLTYSVLDLEDILFGSLGRLPF